jgi:hypothetical protein
VEAVEVMRPEGAVVGDPVDERFEAARIDAIVDVSAVASALDEAGAFEGSEVLGDGGLGDVKAGSEFPDGGFAAGEGFEDGAS